MSIKCESALGRELAPLGKCEGLEWGRHNAYVWNVNW